MRRVKIRACVRCGSADVTSSPGGAHSVVDMLGAVGGVYTCRRCGYSGAPVEFPSKKAHQKFLLLLKKMKARGES